MTPLDSFVGLHLQGGFIIERIEFSNAPMVDALGREAAAHTSISGHRFHLRIRAGMNVRELSVTLYHEVLEAVTVASLQPPKLLWDFNESDFEHAANKMHDNLGEATPENLNRMLQFFRFME